MATQALHKKNSAEKTGDQHQRLGREHFTKQRHVVLRFLASMTQPNSKLACLHTKGSNRSLREL